MHKIWAQNLNRFVAHLTSLNITNPHLGFCLFIMSLPNILPSQVAHYFLLVTYFQPQKTQPIYFHEQAYNQVVHMKANACISWQACEDYQLQHDTVAN